MRYHCAAGLLILKEAGLIWRSSKFEKCKVLIKLWDTYLSFDLLDWAIKCGITLEGGSPEF